MFTEFSKMLQSIFRAVTKLAGAAEKGASAVDHIAGWADQTAASFADVANSEREEKLAILKHNAEQRTKTLANTKGPVKLEAPAT